MRGTASHVFAQLSGLVDFFSFLFFSPSSQKLFGSELEVWQVSVLSGRGEEKKDPEVWNESSQRVICRRPALLLANGGPGPPACPVLPILSTVADPRSKSLHLPSEECLQ